MVELETVSELEIKVPNFEGPLDLLLHLIRENEINIYDIPIAQITGQYLSALEMMKSLNLAVAGDFLVMAATLIHIKSRTLLPVNETEEDVEEEHDPRQQLMLRLLEYQKYKEAASGLESREAIWRRVFFRLPSEGSPGGSAAAPEEIDLGSITSYDLLEALNKVIARLPDQSALVITPDELSVRDQISFILSQIEVSKTMLFDQLFAGMMARSAVVITFLALLEVVRIGLVRVIQVERCGPLRLSASANLTNNGGNDGRS